MTGNIRNIPHDESHEKNVFGWHIQKIKIEHTNLMLFS